LQRSHFIGVVKTEDIINDNAIVAYNANAVIIKVGDIGQSICGSKRIGRLLEVFVKAPNFFSIQRQFNNKTGYGIADQDVAIRQQIGIGWPLERKGDDFFFIGLPVKEKDGLFFPGGQ